MRFPSTVEGLSPELLTSVLAERQPEVVVENLRVIETSRCGDGLASTADRVILGLDYAPGRDAGLPSTVLLKTMLLRPHAPDSMYRNEVRFYRDIRHDLNIEAPKAFASVFDEETGQFGIVMEDLKLRSARFPNAATPVTLEEITGLVITLAELHSPSGGMYPIFKKLGLDLIRSQVERNEFKAELIRPLRRSLDQLWDDLWKVQSILDSGACTLLHGDTHIGNTYLLPGPKGGLLDWQLMVKGSWAHDLTYVMVTALDPEERRKHERDLIAIYLDALRLAGVEQAPSENQAWKLYRQSVVWGLVIGWLITPPQNYGHEITAANLSRIVTAAQDLDTFQALP
jgi:aminoglycoside phosphotransferase (APT) family kinase protein